MARRAGLTLGRTLETEAPDFGTHAMSPTYSFPKGGREFPTELSNRSAFDRCHRVSSDSD